MKWFKHDTDASTDAKIKKLLIRHGATGYAIYFHCIELIASDISESNLTFELEHDSEIIADNLKIKGTADKSGIKIVEEIMHYIVTLKLFEDINGKIFCFKLLKRLDLSMTSNPGFRNLITKAKENHDGVMTESCKTRTEETRTEEKKEHSPPVHHGYGENKRVLLTTYEYDKLTERWGKAYTTDLISKMDGYCVAEGKKYKNFYQALINWSKKDFNKPPAHSETTKPTYLFSSLTGATNDK